MEPSVTTAVSPRRLWAVFVRPRSANSVYELDLTERGAI